jgi:transposase InsO family protein
VRFAFVDAEKAHHPVSKLCRAVGMSRAGYYAWKDRPPSAHAQRDAKLRVLVHESHLRSRRTYGSPRVLADLLEAGESVSRKRVVRLMREQGLVARRRRRYRLHTCPEHEQPVAANVLDREFRAERPNQRWAGDTTELSTAAGRLFLAVLLDLHSRLVVGWSLSAVNDRHLVIRAMSSALRHRRPDDQLLHHSDQGSPYASDDYQRLLRAHGVTCSMSRRGNCYDNAAVESFFATLKAELGERFETPAAAKEKLFDYIEVFYNQQRRHSSLGNLSPAQFEKATAERKAAS